MSSPKLIVAKSLQDVLAQDCPIIGFWGAPPKEALQEASERLGFALLDLDVYYGAPATKILPEAYCHIIRNCVDNAMALGSKLACVVAATGKEKCDAGRYAAWLVKNNTKAQVIMTENHQLPSPVAPKLCETQGPLKKRVIQIMQSMVEPVEGDFEACEATHGFWGTPPHPIELLDLFPETTHVFGWTRCVEQARPSDLDLEMYVPEDLPTIFFSQGFCPKAQLARHLSEKHRGMHVDIHDSINAATMAKVEAFIRLSRRIK